jgi:hypothetical protein
MRHMQAFGAKLAFALHYQEAGRIVPNSGGAIIRLRTFSDFLNGWSLSDDLRRALGPIKTLHQGKLDVADQFRWASLHNHQASIHLAEFGYDFVLEMYVVETMELVETLQNNYVHRPGQFLAFQEPGTYRSGSIRWQEEIDMVRDDE